MLTLPPEAAIASLALGLDPLSKEHFNQSMSKLKARACSFQVQVAMNKIFGAMPSFVTVFEHFEVAIEVCQARILWLRRGFFHASEAGKVQLSSSNRVSSYVPF